MSATVLGLKLAQIYVHSPLCKSATRMCQLGALGGATHLKIGRIHLKPENLSAGQACTVVSHKNRAHPFIMSNGAVNILMTINQLRAPKAWGARMPLFAILRRD